MHALRLIQLERTRRGASSSSSSSSPKIMHRCCRCFPHLATERKRKTRAHTKRLKAEGLFANDVTNICHFEWLSTNRDSVCLFAQQGTAFEAPQTNSSLRHATRRAMPRYATLCHATPRYATPRESHAANRAQQWQTACRRRMKQLANISHRNGQIACIIA